MIFGKYTLQLCDSYHVTPQQLAFSVLCAFGFAKYEAAGLIFLNAETKEKAAALASDMLRKYPAVAETTEAFAQRWQVGRKREGGEGKHLDTIEDILNALQAAANDTSGKARADIICKMADLQQLRATQTEEARQVHFYLPSVSSD